MALGDAIISTISGQPSIPEDTNVARAPGAAAGLTGNAAPRQSNNSLIASGIAAHRASTAAFH
jgi:hypothetical protein